MYETDRNLCISKNNLTNEGNESEYLLTDCKSASIGSNLLEMGASFDVNDVNFVFYSIESINNRGSCIETKDNAFFNGVCGESLFAHYNDRIIFGQD